jgi:hypothetical protein
MFIPEARTGVVEQAARFLELDARFEFGEMLSF